MVNKVNKVQSKTMKRILAGGYVVVCGGMACDTASTGSCGADDECYSWRAGEEQWKPHSTMTSTRTNHQLVVVPEEVRFINELLCVAHLAKWIYG